MDVGGSSLALLGAVLLLGLMAPLVLARFHLPLASTLLAVGSAVGPHGLGLVTPDDTLATFAFLGATFQMFLSGLEAHDLDLRLRTGSNLLMVGLVGLVPASFGVMLPMAFGYPPLAAGFVGAVLLSSSVLLVFAQVHHQDPGGTTALGRQSRSLAVTLDLGSAFTVFVLLQLAHPHGRFPLPILLGLVGVSVAALRMYVPELAEAAFRRLERTPSAGDQRHVRFTLALMLLVVFAYASLDVPAFLAAFLAGFALAPVEAAPELREKLQLVGQSIFVPVFLVALGIDTDLTMLARWEPGNLLVTTLVLGAIVLRGVGAYAGGRRLGWSARHAGLFAFLMSPRMSVMLTAAYAGFRAGIIDTTLLTALVLTGLVTSVFAPVVASAPAWWRDMEPAGVSDA